MTPGQYGCVRTGGFLGWLIRVGTRSRYNHAFIVMDGGQVVQADPKGASWGQLSDYQHDAVVFSQDVLSPEQRAAIMNKAVVLLGTPYGWTDIVRLALRCAGVQWQWLTRAADNERAMICSQLVSACGAAAGVDWLCGREAAAAVTPGDLAARVSQLGLHTTE